MISLLLEVFTLFPACLATQIPGRANIFRGSLSYQPGLRLARACAWHEQKAVEHESRLEKARTVGIPANVEAVTPTNRLKKAPRHIRLPTTNRCSKLR